MSARAFVLAHPIARQGAVDAVRSAPDGWTVLIKDAGRSSAANAAQWPYLEGFSRQLEWPVNGAMTQLSAEEWKDILTSAFEGETSPRLAAGFHGGVVMLGRRTSQYGKRRFSEWMDWLKAAAALRGVEPVYRDREQEQA